MVPNFIQHSWNWIPGFQSLVAFKAQCMPVSNAPSWSVLTIIMTPSKPTADFLVTVIPTGILFVVRNLFTFLHEASNFHCFSLTLLPIPFKLNTYFRCHLYFYFRLSIPTILYMHTVEIALVSLNNDILPFPCQQDSKKHQWKCLWSEAPCQLEELLTPETLFQNRTHPFKLKHVQVKLHVTLLARTRHLPSHPDLNTPPFFFQKVFFHINIHLSRTVCFWL